MRRGEVRLTGGCVGGASGSKGRCWLCGTEWEEDNCCNSIAVCPCNALAEHWHDVSYKNIILLLCYWLGTPYVYFWDKWFS